jgi:hypothetical protein
MGMMVEVTGSDDGTVRTATQITYGAEAQGTGDRGRRRRQEL